MNGQSWKKSKIWRGWRAGMKSVLRGLCVETWQDASDDKIVKWECGGYGYEIDHPDHCFPDLEHLGTLAYLEDDLIKAAPNGEFSLMRTTGDEFQWTNYGVWSKDFPSRREALLNALKVLHTS